MRLSWLSCRGAPCVAVVVLLGLLSACASGRRGKTPPATLVPVLSAEFLLGPVGADSDLELAELQNHPGHPAKLRSAWIRLQRRESQAALDKLAEVLFGAERASPSEEAYARYIRAECYTQMGQPERGEFDRMRARELAIDPALRRRLPEEPASPAETPSTAAAPSGVLNRSNWGALPSVAARLDPMGKVWRMTVHHSAMYFRDTSQATCAAQIKVIQRGHMLNKEYGDIGYHFLIDPAGRIWSGRDLKWQGAHARGDNNIGNIGICLLGNFIRGSEGQRPTESQVQALGSLMRDLKNRYHMKDDAVHCHSDFVQTVCPGPLAEPIVERLARELRSQGSGGHRIAARE